MAQYLKLIIPVTFILVGFITGIIFDRFVFNKVKRLAIRSRVPGNELLFISLHGIPKIWFWIAGFYGAVLSLQINGVISDRILQILVKLFTAIFLYSITIVCARFAGGFITKLSQRTEGISPSLLSNLGRIVVYIFGILTILQTLGFSITPILATLGIGSLAIALAFQDTLANLFSGLYIIISKQARTGDYVKLETGQEGYVTDITWRNTVIQELRHNLIVIPNTKLASAIFTNYHLPAKEIMVLVEVGVSYHSDLDLVERVTVEVAKDIMQQNFGGVYGFEPFIRYHSFGEYSINLTVFMRANEFLDQRIVKHAFIKRLHCRYQEEGIQIPFPVHTIHFNDKSPS